jgi:hypothetical protein
LARKIAQLLERDLDWDYILNEAEENSITPLVGRQLQAMARDAVPADVAERLNNACLSLAKLPSAPKTARFLSPEH